MILISAIKSLKHCYNFCLMNAQNNNSNNNDNNNNNLNNNISKLPPSSLPTFPSHNNLPPPRPPFPTNIVSTLNSNHNHSGNQQKIIYFIPIVCKSPTRKHVF